MLYPSVLSSVRREAIICSVSFTGSIPLFHTIASCFEFLKISSFLVTIVIMEITKLGLHIREYGNNSPLPLLLLGLTMVSSARSN